MNHESAALAGQAKIMNNKRQKRVFLAISIALILNSLFLIPLMASAANHDFGLLETAKEAGLVTDPGNAPSPAALGGRLVGYLLSFVGVIFFALMIYGGILWMTARGDAEQVKKAQELIRSAIFGLIVVFLSYAVTNFVITNLLSTTRGA